MIMKLYSIETENLKLDGGAMFGVVPKVLWQTLYPADENNLCNWAMRCLLFEDGNRKILIDNGIGTKLTKKFLKHYFLNGDNTLEKSLDKYGFNPDDITDMVLTHLHFDHCGGSIKHNEDRSRLIPAFKNATYWISTKQWELANNPNDREKASFLKDNIVPIEESGQLKLIDEECELFPNFYVKIFSGHSAGQIIPVINFNDRPVAFMADLLPSAAHIPMSWIMSYDTSPLETLNDKERFYYDAVKNDYVLFFEHDLYNECCTLQSTEKGVRVKEKFTLKEFAGE